MSIKIKYLVAPNPLDKNLTKEIDGFDENFKKTRTKVIIEKDLTIYLNNQEIVTLMTVGDHPEYLAVGYLLNQNMLKKTDKVNKQEFAGKVYEDLYLKGILKFDDNELIEYFFQSSPIRVNFSLNFFFRFLTISYLSKSLNFL